MTNHVFCIRAFDSGGEKEEEVEKIKEKKNLILCFAIIWTGLEGLINKDTSTWRGM